MDRLRKLIAPLVHPALRGKISADADLVKDLGLDALALVGLVCYVEDEFDVSVPPEGEGEWRTVGEIEQWLQGHCSALAEPHPT